MQKLNFAKLRGTNKVKQPAHWRSTPYVASGLNVWVLVAGKLYSSCTVHGVDVYIGFDCSGSCQNIVLLIRPYEKTSPNMSDYLRYQNKPCSRKPSTCLIWLFPKIKGPNVGVRRKRIIIHWALFWGPLFMETPICPGGFFRSSSLPRAQRARWARWASVG